VVHIREATQKSKIVICEVHVFALRIKKTTARELGGKRSARSAVDVADESGKSRRRSKAGQHHPHVDQTPLDRDATSEPEKTFMIVRQPKRGGSFAARSKWRKSNEGHPQPKRDLNAQRNYERYVALARAEELAGNKVGAENDHHFAEHYYRLMSSDHESS
jgi:hypothetical protein